MFCRGRGGQPSACAVLDKRMNEALRLAEQLVCDLQDSGMPTDDVRSEMQSVKSYIWSELNGLTNSFGPLRRIRREPIRNRSIGERHRHVLPGHLKALDDALVASSTFFARRKSQKPLMEATLLPPTSNAGHETA